MVTILGLALMVGCGETASEPGAPDDALGGQPEVVAPPLELAPSGCEVPQDLATDPLILLSRSKYKKAHFQDVGYESERGIIFVAGLPGLIAYQDTAGEPSVISRYPPEALNGSKKNNRDYQHLEIVSDSLVALTNRGVKKPGQMGVHLIDTTDPAQMAMWPLVTVPAAAGLVAHEGLLYVVSHEGGLYIVDLSDPDRAHEHPKLALSDLGNPWEIVTVGDRAYIADNSLGVVTVDISAPEQPTLVGVTPASGGPQDLVASDATLYVASGSTGVEIFDISDPDVPQKVSTVDIGGPVISVAVSGSMLYTADHAGVGFIDVSAPSAPIPLAFEETPSWAMHVSALEDRLFLADWNALSIFEADPQGRAPEARLNRDEIYLVGEATQTTFELSNRGSEPLVISGALAEDARLHVAFDRLEIAPGDTATGHVSLEAPAPDLDSALCIATNDPDQPLQELRVAASSQGSSVTIGDTAPDFTLQGLDGQFFTLSQQLGHPVILCYFATW